MDFKGNGEKVFIEKDGVCLGYVCLTLVNSLNKEEYLNINKYIHELNAMPECYGVIDKIYINEESRGIGYGSRVMQEIIEYFKDKVNLILLLPHPISSEKKQIDGMEFHNLRMKLVEFYKQFGFVVNDSRYMDNKNMRVTHMRPMFLTIQ